MAVALAHDVGQKLWAEARQKLWAEACGKSGRQKLWAEAYGRNGGQKRGRSASLLPQFLPCFVLSLREGEGLLCSDSRFQSRVRERGAQKAKRLVKRSNIMNLTESYS